MKNYPALHSLLGVCFLLLPCSVPAQGLGSPTARWTNDFSRLGGVAELPDGRVVIVDSRDGTVHLGPANGGSARQLGRQGEGPDEYLAPFSVLRGSGDTLLVYARNRLVRVTPAGTIAGSHPFTAAGMGGSVSPPRGVDRDGFFFWERPVIASDP